MRLLVLPILLALLLLATTPALAHAGFQVSSGSTVIDVLQTPISPLVDEKVKMFLAFTDESVIVRRDLSEKNEIGLPVTLTVTDTFFGNAKKDQIVFRKTLTTDTNGRLELDYIFPNSDYYDIDISFKDKAGHAQDAGFLVQPRPTPSSNTTALIFGIIGLILGITGTTQVLRLAKN